MAKRFLETTLWTQNKWFRKLTPKSKLLWVFLITNCDAVGVWEEDTELASFLIGEKIVIDDLNIFGDRIEFITPKKIWIVDFCKFQYGTLSELSRPHVSYIKMLVNYGLQDRVVIQSQSSTINAVRKRLTQTKKEEILNKYKYECQYCGDTGIEMVVDHIIPIVKGGNNEDNNLICVCTDCNIKKKDLSLQDFYDKYTLYKKLDRVCKVLQSLKEKDKEKDMDKEKEKDKEKDLAEKFETVWKLYPRKLGKDKSFDKFKKQIKNEDDYNNIIKAVKNYVISEKDTETQFIKHGSTFFNKDWKDYINYKEVNNGNNKTANTKNSNGSTEEISDKEIASQYSKNTKFM